MIKVGFTRIFSMKLRFYILYDKRRNFLLSNFTFLLDGQMPGANFDNVLTETG